MTTGTTKFYLDQLEPLIGGKIVQLADAGEGFYGIVIQTVPKGIRKILILMSDDEGNDPGSFEIIDEE